MSEERGAGPLRRSLRGGRQRGFPTGAVGREPRSGPGQLFLLRRLPRGPAGAPPALRLASPRGRLSAFEASPLRPVSGLPPRPRALSWSLLLPAGAPGHPRRRAVQDDLPGPAGRSRWRFARPPLSRRPRVPCPPRRHPGGGPRRPRARHPAPGEGTGSKERVVRVEETAAPGEAALVAQELQSKAQRGACVWACGAAHSQRPAPEAPRRRRAGEAPAARVSPARPALSCGPAPSLRVVLRDSGGGARPWRPRPSRPSCRWRGVSARRRAAAVTR